MAKKRTRADVQREAALMSSPSSAETVGESEVQPPPLPPRDTDTTRSVPRRRVAQRAVAESRAAHFARPDRDGATSADIRNPSDAAPAEAAPEPTQERWPGPFSTAMRMIQERESAKQNREISIAKKASGAIESIEGGENEGELDEYDSMLAAAKDRTYLIDLSRSSYVQQKIPSLADLSMSILADNFNYVDDMGELPSDLRGLIALEVSKRRKLTNRALMAIVPAIVSSISIPDCSAISEEGLKVCFQNSVLNDNNEEAERSSLRVLSLHNCGGCFTDNMATSLLPAIGDLEVLSLRGCFKLNDNVLAKLLQAAPCLRSLDMSCSLRFRKVGLTAVSTLKKLTSLCLDSINYLTDSDIDILSVPTMEKLSAVSLSGLTNITNISVCKLASICSNSLTHLNVKGCSKLTGDLLTHLRNTNLLITHLDISDISNFSTADLLMFFSPIEWVDHVASTSASSKKPQLRTRAEFQNVHLNNLHNLVDDVIIQLCRTSENSLRELSVAGCGKLSGRMAMGIVRHCSTMLQRLTISFDRSIEECAILDVVSKCEVLMQITVWGCTQLTKRLSLVCQQRGISINGYLERGDNL